MCHLVWGGVDGSGLFLEMERVTRKGDTWRAVKTKRIGGMKSKWGRTTGKCTAAVQEWRDPCEFPELSLTAQIVSILTSSTTRAAGKS